MNSPFTWIKRRLSCTHHLRNRQQPNRWQPCLEMLEDRLVPAGNVTATFIPFAGVLMLEGDDLDNHVTIRSGKNPGDVIIHGLNTTINGGSQKVAFEGVSAIQADFGNGDDHVNIVNLTLQGRSIRPGGPLLSTELTIDTRAGNDRVHVQNSNVDRITVLLGSGEDTMIFNHNTFVFAELHGGFDIGPGSFSVQDSLNAHNNTGDLTWFDFEDVNVT